MLVFCATEKENKDTGAEMSQRLQALEGFSVPAH